MIGPRTRADQGSQADDRLSLRVKASYGFGSVAFGAAATGASLLQIFLNQVLGLPALTVGVAIMITLGIDAVLDLIVGRWSDRLRTRWGRRHPFMYASAVPAAVLFYLLWNPPARLEGEALFAYILVIMIGARVSVSLYEIASSALTPELTAGFDERTTLQSWRMLFGVVGAAGSSLLLNLVFLGSARNHAGILYRQGYAHWAGVVAAVILTSILVSALGTHERIARLPVPPRRTQSSRERWREIRLTLMNRSLTGLLLGGVIGGVALGLTSTLRIYLYTHFWDLGPRQFGLILPIGAVGSLLAVVIAPALSRRFGKKPAMIGLFLISVVTAAGPLFLRLVGAMPPNGSPWILPILALDEAVTATLGVVGFILAGSMVADVVEDAAVRSGARSEGLLFALNGLLRKFTGGIGAFVAGVLLTVVHFPAHAARGSVDPAIMRHLVVLYLPATVVLNLLAIAALGLYRIDRQTHERNLETLRGSVETAMESHVIEAVVAGEAASPNINTL